MRTPRRVSRPSHDDHPERGLYVDEATGPHGETDLALIDRRGDVVVRAQVAHPVHVAAMKRALLDLLERIDPPPPIRLI